MSPVVGIIANPVSARDIRRVIANATSLQITDRANIVLRVLACLKATGIDEVVMMPENGGIRHHVRRGLDRDATRGEFQFPAVRHLDFRVTGTVDDTIRAAAEMKKAGCAIIVVLGGDGTHRAVVSACGDVPIAGISTGTNNAFPEHREPTITGLAVGLAATGRVSAATAYMPNKKIVVSLGPGRPQEIALVDAAIVTERYIGARALWRTETFRELLVTFADPMVIGMSAIAGLLQPLGRRDAGGLMVELKPDAPMALDVAIAPGMVRPIGIAGYRKIAAGERVKPSIAAGSLALDGERELSFSEADDVAMWVEKAAFRTVDVPAVMQAAARDGLMRHAADVLNATANSKTDEPLQHPLPP